MMGDCIRCTGGSLGLCLGTCVNETDAAVLPEIRCIQEQKTYSHIVKEMNAKTGATEPNLLNSLRNPSMSHVPEIRCIREQKSHSHREPLKQITCEKSNNRNDTSEDAEPDLLNYGEMLQKRKMNL
ncbi:unnamed protein product [Owenia fusiformis]|uniref:Uncharacterized protein n=1 Tax=Owenia fusiformis TaxID=6347 RepID=A0A8S4NCK4_OWEFU|nr:unnamed protein product [Owenia fusiformis]